ncbi:MAG: ATP-binding protein [Spirosomataceae bacterium]
MIRLPIKTKLTWGLIFFFSLILVSGGLGYFFLNTLMKDARNILQDNYESIDYVEKMREAAHNNDWKTVESNLVSQEHNVTEVGEQEATQHVRNAFQQLKSGNQVALTAFEKGLSEINTLNRQAIFRKHDLTLHNAQRSATVLAFIVTGSLLIAFTLLFNLPGYIANPIQQLTESIRRVTERNFSERLHFTSSDEFGELARTFNRMAEKLDEYENSNLQKLLSEKKRIETIINNMSDAVVGLDEKSNILFINQLGENLLNLHAQTVVGRYAPDVALQNDLLRLLLQNPTDTKPLKIFANDKESYFSREVIPIQDPSGQAVGLVILLRNITSFQEKDLAKTNFIATISHELKTPLSAIKMSLKLLEDERIGSLNPEQSKLIKHLKDDSERLLNITGELLNLTQAESGQIQLHVQETDLVQVVNYALQAVDFLATQKHILLRFEPQSFPFVKADPDKTAWVLINLLTNALKNSPEYATIEITPLVQAHQLVCQVRDQGKGIPAAVQAHIFDKFFHTSDTNSTGMGLAIAKDFIEAQGGQIWFESQEGVGTTFSFSLQLA